MRKIYLLGALLISKLAWSQPNTDIYLFRIDQPTPGEPINISSNPGYDNQPSFWEDSESIIYARTIEGQTEIARYFIKTKETEIITNTLQGSEYSPTQIPGTKDISSIRLDTTGLQLLYRYDLEGNSSVLVPELKIGYHAWMNPSQLAAFVLGSPATLQIIDTESAKANVLIENPGRSIHTMKMVNGFSYVDKNQDPDKIVLFNPERKFKDNIIDLPKGTEDYCWSADYLSLFSSLESKIIISNEGADWRLLVDITEYGIPGKITRLASSPDGKWLAVVIGD